jgi:hypothetical protein
MISIHARLRWAGHVVKMPDHRLPKKLLYGELQMGKRLQGGQKKIYKNTLKHWLFNWAEKLVEVLPILKRSECFSTLIQHYLIHWVNLFLHQCEQCNRLFRARIDLVSHLWTHSKIDWWQCGLDRLRWTNTTHITRWARAFCHSRFQICYYCIRWSLLSSN